MTQATSTDAADKTAPGAMVLQAEQALRRGEVQHSLELAMLASSAARKDCDRELLAQALLTLARAECTLGRWPSGYAHAIEAYSLFEACGDRTRQLWALNICAGGLNVLGDRARAIRLFQQGLSFANGPDQLSVRCILLRNLADILTDEGEFREALTCLMEAVSLARDMPGLGDELAYVADEEVLVRMQYADDLQSRGLVQASLAQRSRAAGSLLPLDYAAWQGFSRRQLQVLPTRVRVLTQLGQTWQARCVAAVCLRAGRKVGRRSDLYAACLHAVAALHRACGALSWAIRMERRALICWTTSNGPDYRIQLLHLALDHAALGDHVSALACRKELALHRSQQNKLAAALRARLAAIEREAERRRYRANEERTHMQRLAVIGRLIAQTHHALNVPAEQALALAQRASMARDDAAELKPLLGELSRTIDQAATLVNQLKLFSYRSTPQPMALSIGEALQSAWRGLAPHLGADARLAQLNVQDDAEHLQAWCDAQRLGIMLKLLLIELTQPTDSNDEPVRINAHIEGGDGADVVLCLQIPCRQGAPPCGPESQPPQITLGVLLCQEIAGEMGGALDVQTRFAASLCYRLRLPYERASVQHLSVSL